MSHPFLTPVFTSITAPPSDPSTVMAASMNVNPTDTDPSLPPVSHILPTSSPPPSTDAAAVNSGYVNNVIDLAPVNSPPPANNSNGSYSFVPTAGQKKRPRRKYHEIERLYHCNFKGCPKAYGTLNHLNAHVAMQTHGPKRLPVEFKEMRKQWRNQKREERDAEAAVVGVSSELSLPSTTSSTTTATSDPIYRHSSTIHITTDPTATAFPSTVAGATSMMMGMDPECIAFSYSAPPPPSDIEAHHSQHHTSLLLPPYMSWQGFVGPTSVNHGSVSATVVLTPY